MNKQHSDCARRRNKGGRGKHVSGASPDGVEDASLWTRLLSHAEADGHDEKELGGHAALPPGRSPVCRLCPRYHEEQEAHPRGAGGWRACLRLRGLLG